MGKVKPLKTVSFPVLFPGGHAEARRVAARLSKLVEDRGVKVVLDCPQLRLIGSPAICVLEVRGATTARARWAWTKIVSPLLHAAARG